LNPNSSYYFCGAGKKGAYTEFSITAFENEAAICLLFFLNDNEQPNKNAFLAFIFNNRLQNFQKG